MKFLNVFKVVAKAKLRNSFKIKKLSFLLTVASWLFICLGSYSLSKIIDIHQPSNSISNINLGIFLLLLSNGIFPIFSPLIFLKKNLPLTVSFRVHFIIVNELFSLLSLLTLTFIFLLTIFSGLFNCADLFTSVCVFILASLTNVLLRSLILFRFNAFAQILVIFWIPLVLFAFFFTNNNFYIFILIILSYLLFFIIEISSKEERSKFDIKSNRIFFPLRENSYLLYVLNFRNSKIKILLLMVYIIKFFILFILIPKFQTLAIEDENYIFLKFYIKLFLSPVLFFTYIYNNYYGYLPELWLNYRLSPLNNVMSKNYFKNIFFILSLDFLFFVVSIWIKNIFSLEDVFLYLNTAIISALIGMYCSYFFAFRVKQAITFSRPNTSFASIFLIAVGFAVTYSIYWIEKGFFLTILLIISLVIFNIKSPNRSIYEKVFN